MLGVPILTAHAFTFSAIADRKCKRSFAVGDISLASGILGMVVVFVAGFGLAVQLPDRFLFTLLAYFGLTISYSFCFKRIMLIDVLLLASLYTIRIAAGAYAIEVSLSSWLLGFSMFIFLSLA